MKKANQKKVGVILAYISQGIHMISGIVYTPIMLRLLGQSEYGLYQLVNSFVSYLGLLSFGFSGAYMRFYAKYEKEGDIEGLEKLNGMFMIIFTVITLLVLLSGLFLTINIESIFSDGLSSAEYGTARILMILMVLGLSTTMFSTVFTCYATAHEQFIFQRLLEVLQSLLNPFITLPLLLLGHGSIAMVVVSTSLVFAKFIANYTFCRKKLKIKFRFKGLNFKVLKELGTFTFFIFLNQIIDKINWSLDKVLLGRFCGTIQVAIYGVAANINLMYQNLLSAISSVFTPKVNRIVAGKKGNEELTNLFIKVGRVQFILAALIISGFIIFGQEFIILWAGKEYGDSYYIGLLLLIPATMELIQYLGIEIQRAKNMHKTRSIVYAIISIGNIAISIPLIIKYGPVGAAIGTAVTLLLGTWLFMNIYYHKRIGIDIIKYWKSISEFLPCLLVTTVLGILINIIIKPHGWKLLIVSIAIYTVIYSIVMYKIGMNKEEKNMVTPIFKKFASLLKKKEMNV